MGEPTPNECEQLHRRRGRLEQPGFAEHVTGIGDNLQTFTRQMGTLDTVGLRLRRSFSHLAEPIDGDSSDRTAPPRELRPSATRISNSVGSALRFELTMLALLQSHRRPGSRAHLAELEIPIAGTNRIIGWADLVAVLPKDSNHGGIFHRARDKRARTVRSTLDTLQQAGLVDVPGGPRTRNRYEGFVPLHEEGSKLHGELEEYSIPTPNEPRTFVMPPGFIRNGWIHVLEDSEITVLLMAACGAGAWFDSGLQVFTGEVRLRHYGIHRNPYSAAVKTLEWFGLLDVVRVGRHADGKAENNERYAHRTQLRSDGFEVPAHRAVVEAITSQIGPAR